MRSALTSYERDLLRAFLAERPRRRVATWHPVELDSGDRGVRVTINTWGRRDVIDQEGVTVQGLKDAWHVVVTWLDIPHHQAADKHAFLAWVALGKR